MDLWNNDKIQFARLLCEILATQGTLDVVALEESMDLSRDEINQLFDRARKVFEDTKRGVGVHQVAVYLGVNYEDESGAPMEDKATLKRLETGLLSCLEHSIGEGALTVGACETLVGEHTLERA